MGTEILKSFGTLQSELEQARTSLKYVDESIKRLIGRDPSELAPRPPLKRGAPVEENRNRQRVAVSVRTRNHENDEPPPVKRRNGSVFKRLSERPVHYEEEVAAQPQRQLISKVMLVWLICRKGRGDSQKLFAAKLALKFVVSVRPFEALNTFSKGLFMPTKAFITTF